MNPSEQSLRWLMSSLQRHTFSGTCVDVDMRRVRGGLEVETDYIIDIQISPEISFRCSKKYAQFRTLGTELRSIADVYTGTPGMPKMAAKAIKACDQVNHLTNTPSQPKPYIGKVNYMYVKVLANERRKIIDQVFRTFLLFPVDDSHPFLLDILVCLNAFIRTDHCLEEEQHIIAHEHSNNSNQLASPSRLGWFPSPFPKNQPLEHEQQNTSIPNQRTHQIINPLTCRRRKSILERQQDLKDLQSMGDSAKLLLENEVAEPAMLPNYQHPTPMVASGGTKVGDTVQNNPYFFLTIVLGTLYALRWAADSSITMDVDIFLLIVFAAFCLGLHTPRGTLGGFDVPAKMKGTVVLPSSAVSIITQPTTTYNHVKDAEDTTHHENSVRPMQQFPEGAEIGSHTNCWSQPLHSSFRVRGANYLYDKKKIPSEDFMFPIRRVELFLTDACPDKVGRNQLLMDGKLREKPTFLINFILPWGILIFYFEIPKRFLPFLRAMNDEAAKKYLPSVEEMTPADRAVCRWLMNDENYKNKRIKIVPVVVDGPWVVRQVVGGKPAIVGTKMPISYHYEPGNGNDEPYLEADLDIAASSAARGILSVARSYTHQLTLNLGFVIEGQVEDELPERMMVGCCLHGIDPPSAPPLPIGNGLLPVAQNDDDSR